MRSESQVVALDAELHVAEDGGAIVGVARGALSIDEVLHVGILHLFAVEVVEKAVPSVALDAVPALDRRAVDAQATAYADILIEEKGSLHAHCGGGAELEVEVGVAVLIAVEVKLLHVEIELARAPAQTHRHREEGGMGDVLMAISWREFANTYFQRSSSWFYHKMDGIDGNGGVGGFSEEEADQMRNALIDLSDRIRSAADRI